jgi:hypothetical protein
MIESSAGNANPGQPAIVCGMHRSGTSMLARLLHGAGFSLGDETRLMPGKTDNPDGFFEHLDFVALNDRLLKTFRGAWDAPADWPEGWFESDDLLALREEARALLEATAAVRPGAWGWKDPRNCLTLPFWQFLRPGIRVVHCVRNPLEVAESIGARSDHSIYFGLGLWRNYHEQFLRALVRLPAQQALVVHYDALLADPESELLRMCGFLGMDLKPAEMQRITAHIRRRAWPVDRKLKWIERAAGSRTVDLYEHFCQLAAGVATDLARPADFERPPVAEPVPEQQMTGGVETLARQQSILAATRRKLAAQFVAKKDYSAAMGPYRCGTVLDLRKGGNAWPYTLHGWSAPEPEGCWTDGHGAALLLPGMAGLEPTGVVRLRVQAAPFLPDGVLAQGVDVRVNGHHVGKWMIDRDSTWSIPAAASLFDAGEAALIELLVSHPTCGPNAHDRREFGIKVSTIVIEKKAIAEEPRGCPP